MRSLPRSNSSASLHACKKAALTWSDLGRVELKTTTRNASAFTGLFFPSLAEDASDAPGTRPSGVDSYGSASFKTLGCQFAFRIYVFTPGGADLMSRKKRGSPRCFQ